MGFMKKVCGKLGLSDSSENDELLEEDFQEEEEEAHGRGHHGDGVGGVVDPGPVELAELLGDSRHVLVGLPGLLQLRVDVFLDLSHGFPELVARLVELVGFHCTVASQAVSDFLCFFG